ncbi:uncharacterized protein Dana_GF27357 [Drosophila ananassae]|uniref:Uncharacterized protein n=2 Tax=Drosophila ananassae TaxID=7217 RepID=A0A0N8NZ33_DROAN|nr:uncharacterized protein LOC26514766 isoform X2 [Drosophila ananassae]KPU73204.1 uncharacterized protein Dana_GF27357 [Drosophila ananassae]
MLVVASLGIFGLVKQYVFFIHLYALMQSIYLVLEFLRFLECYGKRFSFKKYFHTVVPLLVIAFFQVIAVICAIILARAVERRKSSCSQAIDGAKELQV